MDRQLEEMVAAVMPILALVCAGIFLNGKTGLQVTAGAGETVTISDDIASDGYRDPNDATNSDPAGDGLDGGVKMSGGGLLNLHGTNSYLGGTQVSGGGTVNIIADKGLGHSSESSL